MAYSKFDRVTFRKGKYAGIKVIGDDEVDLDEFRGPTDQGLQKHMVRAAYLATKLESPQWGSVQSYDNAGISAGPFHWIAHYPRGGKQGPLFGLLRAIETAVPNYILSDVWSMLEAEGWYVAMDGKLRSTTDGSLIDGRKIRDVVAAPKGFVPKVGPERDSADNWALAFHELMSRDETKAPQIQYAIEYLTRGQHKLESQAYRLMTGLSEDSDLGSIRVSGDGPQIDLQEDLAMAVYHAHSVNAPGPAASCLREALRASRGSTDTSVFPKRLIRALGKKKYGAWDKRYVRTRQKAQQSGLWDRSLFTGKSAVMPVRLA